MGPPENNETPAPPGQPWRVQRFHEVSSTNETILSAGEQGAPEWTVHLARCQTSGRGRGSHTWWSPPGGGLWMSVLLRPSTPPARLGGMALIAGVAVRGALQSLGARGIDLYWPNDLYLGSRKLGGILGEVRRSSRSPGGSMVALGIGINLDFSGAEPPPELRGAIACLAETGCGILVPETVAAAILEKLLPLYHALLAGASIPGLVKEAMAGLGGRVRVSVPPALPFGGIALGIGDDGELLVERDGGIVEALRSAQGDWG